MSCFTGRMSYGLFDNSQAEEGTDRNFTSFNYTTVDFFSGSGCFTIDYNIYGASLFGDIYIPVDPINKSYIMSLYAKTTQVNYLGNLGSGHLGFAGYDKDFNFISHDQAFSLFNTVLTRQANPNDTSIYIARGDWSVSATNHYRSINFYPSAHPEYNVVGGYTRLNIYDNAYSTTGIVDVGGGEWRVDLLKAVPDWGISLPAGTPVGNTHSGSSFNYALGAPNYPMTWTRYTTPVMTGEVLNAPAGGANFRHKTRYIRFLNLANYNYRTEVAGNSARYAIDNILWIEGPNSKLASLSSSFYDRTNTFRLK